MNIKRLALMLVLVLFAAPFAADSIQFTDVVVYDPSVELLVRVSDVLRDPRQLQKMSAPTDIAVDVAIAYPNTWSAGDVTSFLGELTLAEDRLDLILSNSHINWLRFPRLAMESYVPNGTESPLTLEQVNAIRARTGADRVVAIVDQHTYGGSAMLCGPYAVVKRSALFDAYAHELLHTVCLDHNPESAVTPPEGVEDNRAMWVCPAGSGDGFATFMTTNGVPCGWYSTNSLSGPGNFYQGVELVAEHARQTEVLAISAPLAAAEVASVGPCVADAATLCIDAVEGTGDKRFEVHLSYETFSGATGNAFVQSAFAIGGNFGFFSAGNPELMVKVVNFCSYPDPPLAGHFVV